MEPLPGEKEHIRRFQAGDASAFVPIMDHYAPYLLGMLTRLTGDASRAEDLCQETFIKALKGLGRFRDESSLKTWLFRVAHNVAMDHIRAQDPPSAPLEENEETDARVACTSFGADPHARLEEKQLREAVDSSMGALPQAQREALHLFYWGELSVAEIAQALRVPEGTVKTLLFRGRKALRSQVGWLVSEKAP